jgi:bifunctional UDP-N-acetylglucosamine pyrophosphorylase/glucosamine-1-phosphate N-acetyltransferase
MSPPRVLVIPAAGRGARLGASVPKVLVPVNGRPMLHHLLAVYAPYVQRVVVVVGPGALPQVNEYLRGQDVQAETAVQPEPTGMLDAITAGVDEAAPRPTERMWITWGDQVGVQPATLDRLAGIETNADLALPTVWRDAPYIHLGRDAAGRIVRVLQRREGDAMPSRGESDMGLFSLSSRAAREWLPAFAREARRGHATGERNFLPFIAWAAARGPVPTCSPLDAMEAVGINTPEELEAVERWMRGR